MEVRNEVQAIIYDDSNPEIKVLLVSKFDPKKRKAIWRLLKGGVEENESEEVALRREIFEEIGLRDVEIGKKIYEYSYTFRFIKHNVSSFLVKVDSSKKLRLNPKEIQSFTWVPKIKALRMLKWNDEKIALSFL